MRKSIYTVIFFLFFWAKALIAQDAVDVLHYRFELSLQDTTDVIEGISTITFLPKAISSQVSFDLVAMSKGTGMLVKKIMEHDKELTFKQAGEKLIINTHNYKLGDTLQYTITYSGIPGDGLIISKNKFGNRTFFADNWPNRAHHWIPCNDNPIDKATVEFFVTAPQHYSVISNGVLIEESHLPQAKKLTHWREAIALPTKVMVIGVADFAVKYLNPLNCVQASAWVFQEDRDKGFSDYAVAADVMPFLENYIAPFPYKKIAHVQSKTRFGGMENAGAIFYFENSVDGKQSQEALFAHELAHQWFGDMATEKKFSHLWLSEGFATYLTHMYIENKYGRDSMLKRLQKDREEVLAFVSDSHLPVVDTVTTNLLQLLNENSYQKGSWILHMLRMQIGDNLFKKIIRNYYQAYAGKNADTKDFQRIVEQGTGKSWETFFNQWLHQGVNPKLAIEATFVPKKSSLLVQVKQLQSYIFQLPLQIAIHLPNGKIIEKEMLINRQNQSFSIPCMDKPVKIQVDPSTTVLQESAVVLK